MASQADDAWATARAGYSLERIYAASSDRAGTERKNTPIPSSFLAQFYEMQERRELPPQLDTYAAFIRDAMVHRLKWYADNGWEQADTLANMLIRITEIEREKAERASQEHFIESIEKLLYDARSGNDLEGVEKVLNIANDGASSLRRPYVSRVERVIEQAREILGY